MSDRYLKGLKGLNDKALVEEFVQWAGVCGEATIDGDSQAAIRAAYRLKVLDQELDARGRNARSLLLPYLDHQLKGVRYYVAHNLLAIDPTKARRAMQQLAAGEGPMAYEARGTLREIDEGVFVPK